MWKIIKTRLWIKGNKLSNKKKYTLFDNGKAEFLKLTWHLMNDNYTSHCTPQVFHKAVFFSLKQFELCFVICNLKIPNQCNHTFVLSFVSCFTNVLDDMITGWVWKIHFPVSSSLGGFSESWLKRNVHSLWNERRRATSSHEVAAVSHVDGHIWRVWWAPNSLLCTLRPPQLFYYWCWRPTGVKADLYELYYSPTQGGVTLRQ